MFYLYEVEIKVKAQDGMTYHTYTEVQAKDARGARRMVKLGPDQTIVGVRRKTKFEAAKPSWEKPEQGPLNDTSPIKFKVWDTEEPSDLGETTVKDANADVLRWRLAKAFVQKLKDLNNTARQSSELIEAITDSGLFPTKYLEYGRVPSKPRELGHGEYNILNGTLYFGIKGRKTVQKMEELLVSSPSTDDIWEMVISPKCKRALILIRLW